MSRYIEVEFTPKTDIKKFENWLDNYRLQTLPMLIELEEDKQLAVICSPTLKKDNNGFRTHVIEARVEAPHPDNPQIGRLSFPFPVIEFVIFEPSEGRVNVKARLAKMQMLEYYFDMLKDIARLWPETKNEIEEFFEKWKASTQEAGKKHKCLEFSFYLGTTYREYLDWFEDNYSYIKLKYRPKNQIDLVFPNSTHAGQMTISLIDGGIKLTGWYSFYGSNEWLEILKNRSKNYFGELPEKRKGGRPGLSEKELIYRISKAQEAEEIKEEDPKTTWKEIAYEIGWRHGNNKAGVKLLEDARHRLGRLQDDDPTNLLAKVKERRKKKET